MAARYKRRPSHCLNIFCYKSINYLLFQFVFNKISFVIIVAHSRQHTYAEVIFISVILDLRPFYSEHELLTKGTC